ncbi:MAG: hypothetical protein H6757_00785 [Candidatus Omnitrophica bacterium]|nr:hypothetical protein [Candidatus Omnitrophota bacterium]
MSKKMTLFKHLGYCAGIIAILLLCPQSLYAQTPDEEILHEVQRLQALKESNPDQYQQIIAQKRNGIQRQFTELQARDPERAENFRQKRLEARQEYFQFLREKNPDQFEKIMERRANHWQEKAAKNPERFQAFLEKHPELGKRQQAFLQRGALERQKPAGALNSPPGNRKERGQALIPTQNQRTDTQKNIDRPGGGQQKPLGSRDRQMQQRQPPARFNHGERRARTGNQPRRQGSVSGKRPR